MKKALNYLPSALCGAAYSALAVGLSRLLIRNLAPLFRFIGGLASLDEETLVYGHDILAQLQGAVIVSPWLPALLIGAAAGLLSAWLISRPGVTRIVINLTLYLILLIPLALIALWFTSVNAISVSALIQSILPILPHIL